MFFLCVKTKRKSEQISDLFRKCTFPVQKDPLPGNDNVIEHAQHLMIPECPGRPGHKAVHRLRSFLRGGINHKGKSFRISRHGEENGVGLVPFGHGRCR